MTLSEKLRALREAEGVHRGLGRPLTQGEMAQALGVEQGRALSQSYLSQIESGARPHLTNTSRLLLARFFRVHPGYLVDDPVDFEPEQHRDPQLAEERLDVWLAGGVERLRRDPEISRALLAIARYDDSRRALMLLGGLLESSESAQAFVDWASSPMQQPAGKNGRAKRPSAVKRDTP